MPEMAVLGRPPSSGGMGAGGPASAASPGDGVATMQLAWTVASHLPRRRLAWTPERPAAWMGCAISRRARARPCAEEDIDDPYRTSIKLVIKRSGQRMSGSGAGPARRGAAKLDGVAQGAADEACCSATHLPRGPLTDVDGAGGPPAAGQLRRKTPEESMCAECHGSTRPFSP